MLCTAQAQGVTSVEYCRGVIDTIHALAVQRGISWPDMRQAITEALHDDAKYKLISDLIHFGVLSSLDNNEPDSVTVS
jgi:hypothetical protein